MQAALDLNRRYGGDLDRALSSRHMPVLDGLRALAAMAVVFYHFDEERFPIGGTGVLAFFVLSGFLITWLMCDEAERTSTISLRRFYARRSLRIFPAFYVYWLAALALALLLHVQKGRPMPWAQAAASFFYVCNYYQGLNHYPSSGFSHTWSLGVEEQFYLLWPAAFCMIVRLSPLRRVYATAGLVALFFAIRLTLHLVVGVPEEYVYTAFETRADQLAVGCLLAVVLRSGVATGIVRVLITPAATLATLGLFVASQYLSFTRGTGYRNVVGFSIEPALVATLILQLFAAHRSPWVRWLDSRPMRFLGGLSYSIHLYQQLVLHILPRFVPKTIPMLVRLPISAGAVVLVAYASYRFVEQPFNRMKARFAAPTTKPDAGAEERASSPREAA
jgi:peptidoglycan/LPS O-acetylase OafA/YrhL